MTEKKLKISADGGNAERVLDGVGGKLGGLGLAAQGAQVLWDALAGSIGAGIEMFSESEAVIGRATRTIRKHGVGLKSAIQDFAAVDKELKKIRREGGSGINELRESFTALNQVNKDVKTSTHDVALAQDIASQAGIDLAAATEAVKKTRQGEVGQLKDLGILTKNQEARLSGLTNETERIDTAMGLLNETYRGAAKENAGLAEKLSTTEDELKAVQTAAGEVAAVLGQETVGLISRTAQYFNLIKENESVLGALEANLKDVAIGLRDIDQELLVDLLEAGATGFKDGFGSPLGIGLAANNIRNRLQDEGISKQERAKTEAELEEFLDRFKPTAFDVPEPVPDVRKKKPKKRGGKAVDIDALGAAEAESVLGGIGGTTDANERFQIAERELELAKERDAVRRVELELELELFKLRGEGLSQELEAIEADKLRLEATDRLAAAFAAKNEKIDETTKTTKEETKVKRELTEIEKTQLNLTQGAIGAVTDIAAAQVESKQAVSALAALQEGAFAFGSLAVGDLAGAKLHGEAAALHAIVAAVNGLAGTGGASQSSGGGVGSQTSEASRGLSDFEDDVTRQSINGGNRSVLINFYSAASPTPEDARQIRDTVAFDEANNI